MEYRDYFRSNLSCRQALFVYGAVTSVALALSAGVLPAGSPEVNVYSARKEALIKPLLDRFSEETGITVNLVTGKAGQLHERLAAEGRNSPADLFITVDAGNLHRAKKAGLLQPARMTDLDERVPARYRDPDGAWYGLSLRARVIVYAVDRVEASQLSSYEDLADPKWADRLLVRSSGNVYNQSLIASMIAALGEEGAERWARGIVANMARRPQGGDTDQIRSLAAGEGDVALVNTYYYARLAASDRAEDRAVAERTRLFFPNQEGRGAHVNVSGAGITAHSPNLDNARRLLAFLASEEGQRMFAELNHEIPVDPQVPASDVVESWGKFKADPLPLATLGTLNGAAIRLADRAGWR
jgi:iron(III) transport system substrate-binding protein